MSHTTPANANAQFELAYLGRPDDINFDIITVQELKEMRGYNRSGQTASSTKENREQLNTPYQRGPQ